MSDSLPPFESKGEQLASYLQRDFLGYSDPCWSELSLVLLPSNRAYEWVEAFKEMLVLQLVRRLISSGSVILKQYNRDGEELVAEEEIKKMINDTMIVHSTEDVDAIYDRLFPAIRARRSRVSNRTKYEVMLFAETKFPYCYLCGAYLALGDIYDDQTSIDIDHVWPRSYGGDSAFENLLVVCKKCNKRKSNIPSWAMYPIQSLVERFDRNLGKIPTEMRFSVQTRRARKIALEENVSLREAFLKLGRPDTLVVLNERTAIDVFNLTYSHHLAYEINLEG